MNIKISPKIFKKDLKNLNKRQKSKAIDKIEELQEETTAHPKAGYVSKHGIEFFRLKFEIGENSYRALFQIEDNVIKVKGVIKRPPEEYDEETIEEKVMAR